MNIEDISNLVSTFVKVGYMTAVKAYEPVQDLIKSSEVELWLKANNLDVAKFNALSGAGVIKRVRKGECKNSAFYYSKKEIAQAFGIATVSSIIVNNEIRK